MIFEDDYSTLTFVTSHRADDQPQPRPQHRRHIDGATIVLAILGVIFIATSSALVIAILRIG